MDAPRFDLTVFASIFFFCPYAPVYKHKALALKAVGRLDEAIETMNRAVLYETPWKPQIVEKALKLYRDLIAERDAKQTKG
jgi:hypothetical protein